MEVLGIYIPAKATVYRRGTTRLFIVADYVAISNISLQYQNKECALLFTSQ